jgi:hypothetical protein
VPGPWEEGAANTSSVQNAAKTEIAKILILTSSQTPVGEMEGFLITLFVSAAKSLLLSRLKLVSSPLGSGRTLLHVLQNVEEK